MESYNEPLNLSIKKRPVAVVPPSSTKTSQSTLFCDVDVNLLTADHCQEADDIEDEILLTPNNPITQSTTSDNIFLQSLWPQSINNSLSIVNFLDQKQSLDAAKLHLERYLKLTNQYLQTTASAITNTTQESLTNLIHTNILTNKIATNNLISLINKLLEQNIVSEYYFKHAAQFQQQQTAVSSNLIKTDEDDLKTPYSLYFSTKSSLNDEASDKYAQR